MVRILQFDSVFGALRWYAGHEYRRGPRELGNHSPLAAGAGMRQLDTEQVWNTYLAISRLIGALAARDSSLIVALFQEDGPSMKELGGRFRCSTRTILRIRGRVLARLEHDFGQEGLISRRYDPPAYLKEG